MRMGDQYEVDRRQLVQLQGRADQAARPAGDQSEIESYARGEDRVGEDGSAADPQQKRGVPDPGGREFVVGPSREVRVVRSSRRRVDTVQEAQSPPPAPETVREAQRDGPDLRPVAASPPAHVESCTHLREVYVTEGRDVLAARLESGPMFITASLLVNGSVV